MNIQFFSRQLLVNESEEVIWFWALIPQGATNQQITVAKNMLNTCISNYLGNRLHCKYYPDIQDQVDCIVTINLQRYPKLIGQVTI